MKVVKSIGIFLLTFFVYHLIVSSFFPVDENNTMQAPSWYPVVGILLGAITTMLYERSSRKKKDNTDNKSQRVASGNNQAPSIQIPRNKKKRIEMAKELTSTVNFNARVAKESTYISSFVDCWDKMMDCLTQLTAFEGSVDFDWPPPSEELSQRKHDFQWQLRNAIERQKNKHLENVKNLYKNSYEHRKEEYDHFYWGLQRVHDRFSDETNEFADAALDEVFRAAGIRETAHPPFTSSNPQAFLSHGFDISQVDNMEGHDFEFWCADLLRKNGFINVEVTRGSGDQGVDVLAEKGGIRYAIQCKCYQRDLDNTPVQEVHAGKEYYHCQVGAVMTNRHFTAGARELATRTGILLWDRDEIQKMLKQAEEQ